MCISHYFLYSNVVYYEKQNTPRHFCRVALGADPCRCMYRYIRATGIPGSHANSDRAVNSGIIRNSRCICHNKNSWGHRYVSESSMSIRPDQLRWFLYRYAERQSALRGMRECMQYRRTMFRGNMPVMGRILGRSMGVGV